jgi:hypothetical protein
MTELKRYEEDDKRWYETPIGPCISVTSVSKQLNQPFLIPGAVKATGKQVEQVLIDIRDGNLSLAGKTNAEIEAIVKKIKAFYKNDWKKKGQDGTDVHFYIENYFKAILGGGHIGVEITPDMEPGVEAFHRFEKEYDVVPIAVEKRVWSIERYAGTLDFYGYIRGLLSLADWKYSGFHSDNNVMQLGALDKALREREGCAIDAHWVVRLDRKTRMADPIRYTREEIEHGVDRFLALLKYFWLTEQARSGNDKS